MPRSAIVMNMFYTGLGIARSLGARGIPVIGLTARRGVYGNYTRFANVRRCPDSRQQPAELLSFLLQLGKEIGHRAVIFPTRDDDLLFLDRHRGVLSDRFALVIPEHEVLTACLDKWQTYCSATQAGVESPRCWMIENERDLIQAVGELEFPCVLKPVSAHLWRQRSNWEIVGGRKAVAVESETDLFTEYRQLSLADPRVLLQQMVPGDDDQLFVAACYVDKNSRLVASFTAQKLLQVPSIFGTGCIVQTTDRRDLMAIAERLLLRMHLTGIAEVEFKWDERARRFTLIEINARPWDQHGLGAACGSDLVYVAYCEHAGLPMPDSVVKPATHYKWIAEDVFLMTALQMLARRDAGLRALFRLARGKRVYAIWSRWDMRPFFTYLCGWCIMVVWRGARYLLNRLSRFASRHLARTT